MKIVTNRHLRVAGVTWDILDSLRYIAHHESRLRRWGTADAATLRTGLLVTGGDEAPIALEPRQVLRLAVLQ